MERYMDLQEETDGKLYTCKDKVNIGCNDCNGCHKCCTNMGKSIVLDPYDLYSMRKGLKTSFEALLDDKIELSMVDGIILPNLALKGEEEKCGFLDEDGRCGIHNIRPGFCRLFPLGRMYNDNRSFDYIFQVKECPKSESPVVIEQWLNVPSIRKYEKYISAWHFFLKDVSRILEKSDDTIRKNAGIVILKRFFIDFPVDKNDFYERFYIRLNDIKKVFELGA